MNQSLMNAPQKMRLNNEHYNKHIVVEKKELIMKEYVENREKGEKKTMKKSVHNI